MSEQPRAPAIGSSSGDAARDRAHNDRPPSLVVGATGAFGAAVVERLLEKGRPVRALVRNTSRAVKRFGTHTQAELHEGDVFDPERLLNAARGCGVIHHAVSFPMSQWEPGARIALENVLSVARQVGATVVFPGNVWVYGPTGGRRVDESTPYNPVSRKGRIRVELEGMIRESAERGDCRALIVRAGDFFGPTVRNPYHDGIFRSASSGKAMMALGSLDAPHQWAYVPDLARACVKLADAMEKLTPFEIFHFAGHEFERQQAFYDHVKVCAGDGSRKARVMPWLAVRSASVFNKEMREVLELRYLWDEGVLMDDSRLRRLWPAFEPTDIDSAIARTLSSGR